MICANIDLLIFNLDFIFKIFTMRVLIKVGNPFVFSTVAADAFSNKGKGISNSKDNEKDNNRKREDAEFWMYYSAGSTHLADSNIDEPLHLGLGQ